MKPVQNFNDTNFKFQMTKILNTLYKTLNNCYLRLIPARGRLIESNSFFC